MNIFVEIPARGGSKGVPCKALRNVGGMPLIAYTILDALRIKGNTRVIVNTDNQDIREVALSFGAEVPFLRPEMLAGDKASLNDVVAYSRNWFLEKENYKQDIYIIMSPTNPFRRDGLLNKALEKGEIDNSLFNIGSVAPAPVDINNYWVKADNNLIRFPGVINQPGKNARFCQSSMSFNIVYNYRKEFTEDIHAAVMLNAIEAIDIDEVYDLDLARSIVSNGYYPIQENTNRHDTQEAGQNLFGKYFTEMGVRNTEQYVKHPDFPLVSESDFAQFKEYCHGKTKMVVSGAKSSVHPYRLRFIDSGGYSRFLYDVEMSIRGYRQSYPEVFSFVPAMVFIPAGIDCSLIDVNDVEMYEVETFKTLDSTLFPDGAVI